MNADYAKLREDIPRLLKEVETQRTEEEDFLNEMQDKLKKQLEDLKRAIDQEVHVCISFFLTHFFRLLLFRNGKKWKVLPVLQ